MPLKTDIVRAGRHVSRVPRADFSRLVATLAKCLRSTSQKCANPSVGARRFDTTLAFALKGI
jgi:hypothetical protein